MHYLPSDLSFTENLVLNMIESRKYVGWNRECFHAFKSLQKKGLIYFDKSCPKIVH